jgi:hypothetical protein
MIPQLKNLPTEVKVKILIRVLHVLGQLPPSIKDSCSVLMLNVIVELLPAILNEGVQEKGITGGAAEPSYIRDIAISIGVLGSGEPLQVLSRKLLECTMISDNH